MLCTGFVVRRGSGCDSSHLSFQFPTAPGHWHPVRMMYVRMYIRVRFVLYLFLLPCITATSIATRDECDHLTILLLFDYARYQHYYNSLPVFGCDTALLLVLLLLYYNRTWCRHSNTNISSGIVQVVRQCTTSTTQTKRIHIHACLKSKRGRERHTHTEMFTRSNKTPPGRWWRSRFTPTFMLYIQ